MKISMISEHASPLAALGGVDAGGQNVHVAALSEALADRGHDVTVFTRRDRARDELPDTVVAGRGVTVVHVSAGPHDYLPKDEFLPHMLELGRGIAAYWAAHPEIVPDIVHSHFWMSGLAARTALEAAGLADVPLVHTFHALGTVKRRHQGAADTSPAERAALEPEVGRTATHIIATCNDEVRELEAMGVDPAGVSVIPCGVDLDLFRCDTDTDTGTDPGIERPAGRQRIVSVGRLVPRKGMDLVIRALPLLAEAGFPDVELHIIGGGGEQSDLDRDPEARRLRGIAEELGVEDRVILRGQVPRERVPAVLRGADLVACTPWYEPFGIVPLEAMACGVPVLAAKVGGLADTVVDGVTGLHVPPRDPAAIADAAAALLGDPARSAEMGAHGVRRARERYAWPVVAEATEDVYRRLLVGGRTSADRRDRSGVLRLPVPDRAGDTGGDLDGESTGRSPVSPVSPVTPMTPLAGDGIDAHLDGVTVALDSLRAQAPVLGRWGRELAARLSAGQRLLTAGNGGSAAEAQHLSSELVGRFQGDRPSFSAIALTTDTSAVTAISNDYGYEEVFARQVTGHARPGDVLLLLSTSGTSPNLLRAAETARELGVQVWGLTGPRPNPLAELCDEVVAVDAESPNVQEAHLMAVHAVCRAFDAEVARRLEGASERPATRSSARPTNRYQEA